MFEIRPEADGALAVGSRSLAVSLSDREMGHMVSFENFAMASAPVQELIVVD
jgi:hypothetical protein